MKHLNHFDLKCGHTEMESQQEESECKALKQSAKPHDSLSKCVDECMLFYNQSLDENKGENKKRNSQMGFSAGARCMENMSQNWNL